MGLVPDIFDMKDPNGFRPLALGKLNRHYVLASETCAFDLIQAEFIRELEPGEIVIINEDGIESFIQPTQSMRDFAVRVKLNPVRELIKGKDIIIIEDSIIRAPQPRPG